MFNYDLFNKPEPYRFYLCKADDTIVCELNGIVETSASISFRLNNQYELSFDYDRYISTDDGEFVESNGYHSLNIGMNILVEGIGFFRMKYPPMNYDGEREYKSITAYSCECELEDKRLVDFKINTGETDSLEYLVTYDDDETEELLNAYTGLPYDYIVFDNTYPSQLAKIQGKYSDNTTYTNSSTVSEIVSYCSSIPRLKRRIETNSDGSYSLTEYVEYTYDSAGENVISVYLFDGFNDRIAQLIEFYTKYHDQLSLVNLALENCDSNWTVGTIDSSLVNKKFQFSIDSENIYGFLTNDVAQAAKCVFDFDIINRKINVILAENIGKDTGIFIDKQTLLNSIEVSCQENSLSTRFNVSGADELGIQYVNFGMSRIDDLSWFLNAMDENGNLIYVSEDLREKYLQYVDDRNLARDKYIEYTREYNQSLIDIDDIKYRVPNDSMQNDWDTFTDDELTAAYNTYNQLLVTLITLYKEDYGTSGQNSDGSVNETYLKTTEYWYDYYAYKITIEQIEATIYARAHNSSYADIDDESVLEIINAYKTEWSLYGIIELQSKIESYTNSLSVLIDGEAVLVKTGTDVARTWSSLSDEEKTGYSNLESNYYYDDYIKIYNERAECQSYLNKLMSQLSSLEVARDTAQSNRDKLVQLISLKNYNRSTLGKLVTLPSSSVSGTFTSKEISIINRLYLDDDYTNDNILITSLDNTVTEIDVQYELLKDAEEELSKASQPQISFAVEMDNLLAMQEFQNYDFTVGNYVTVQYYDDYYVDVRLYTITFNPCVPEDANPTVEFTNFVRSRSERSDLTYILSGSNTYGSSSKSSSGSGSGGSFGESDDIDVTISNTMLAKLLNTEMFGTRVTNVILDTINVNSITAKYAKFDGLANGTTVIDGACIRTGAILSNNYNGTIYTNSSNVVTSYGLDNTEGSILELTEGKFSFGGGSLKWDGDTLTVRGSIYASSGTISAVDENGDYTFFVNMDTGKVIIAGDNVYIGSKTAVQAIEDLTSAIDDSRVFSMALTNDYQVISVDASGNYSSFPSCTTTAIVMYGSDDVTDSCTFSVSVSSGITGSWNSSTYTYTVTSLTADTAYVDITASYTTLSVTRRFQLTKVYAGVDGVVGVGVDAVTEYYLASPSSTGITISSSGWSKTVPVIDSINRYLWNYEVTIYNNGTSITTDPAVIGVCGTDGVGVSVITDYYLASASYSGVTTSTSGWTTTIQTIDATKRYLWNYETTTYTNGNTVKTEPCIIGTFGIDGVSIDYVTEYYLASASSSGVTTTTSGWTTTVQTISESKRYLWNYEVTTYTDGSSVSTTPYIIGTFGIDGVGINSITEHYLASSSSSNVTSSTSGWTTSIQTIDEDKRYLWNYETVNYTNGTTVNTDPCIIGTFGIDGVGISSVIDYYLASSSSTGVSTSTSGWTTTVQDISETKRYLWNYEKTIYTDNSSTTTTPCVIGTFGIDGVGLKSITEYYMASSSNSGVTTSTSGWSTTVPEINSTNKYLWNYEVVTYTDGTTVSTTPCVIGMYGSGDSGRTYTIELSVTTMLRDVNGKLYPTSITANSYYLVGASTSRNSYSGRWAVQYSTDGSSWTTYSTGTSDVSSITFSPNTALSSVASTLRYIRFVLYASGGTSTILDMQSIPITTDVSALDHETVMSILTNDGEIKCIAEIDGQIYINATYINSGTLAVKNSSGSYLFKASISDNAVIIGGFTVTSSSLYHTKSSLNSSSSGVYIGTDGISLGTGNTFTVTSSGVLTATSATISGTITAGAGSYIGGWIIGSGTYNALVSASGATLSGTSGVYIGTDGIRLGSAFKVTSAGVLTATNATITGTITTSNLTATGGQIGGFYISSTSIYSSSDSFGTVSGNIYIGSSGISLGTTFKVTSAGVLTATSFYLGDANIYCDKYRLKILNLSSTTINCMSSGTNIYTTTSTNVSISGAHQLLMGESGALYIGYTGSNSSDVTSCNIGPSKPFTMISPDTICGYGYNDATTSDSTTAASSWSGGWWEANNLYRRLVVSNRGNCTIACELVCTYINQIRMAYENYGVIFRNDATNFHILLTEKNDAYGTFTSARPFVVNLSTGVVTVATSSDRRLKNDYGLMDEKEAVTLLSQVEIHKFTYINDENNIEYNGIMANDLKDIMISNGIGYRPFLTITSLDGENGTLYDLEANEDSVRYSIDYSKFVPTLWKGWQYHDNEIEQLKNKIQSLEEEISILKQNIA